MQDDEYYRRYSELRDIIKHGYIDYYALKEIGNYNSLVKTTDKALPSSSRMVVQHYCELVKADLGLLLWMMLDGDSKSNTIETLKRYLQTEYQKDCTVKLPTNLKKVRDNELESIRRHSLAHNDLRKVGASIEISTLTEMLDAVRGMLNGLCYTDVDERVQPISDQETYVVGFHVQMGLHLMIENTMLPIEQKSAGEDNHAE